MIKWNKDRLETMHSVERPEGLGEANQMAEQEERYDPTKKYVVHRRYSWVYTSTSTSEKA